MMKYELTDERYPSDSRLRRIRALRDIPRFGVAAGDVGGFVESEGNLSQGGDCWVYGSALVYGSARVCGSARVYGSARVCGSALVYDSARVSGSALVSGLARVYDSARVSGSARVTRHDHVLTIGPVGGHSATLFRTEDGHQIQAGCTLTDLDGLRGVAVEEFGEDSPLLGEVDAVIGLFDARIKSWEAGE